MFVHQEAGFGKFAIVQHNSAVALPRTVDAPMPCPGCVGRSSVTEPIVNWKKSLARRDEHRRCRWAPDRQLGGAPDLSSGSKTSPPRHGIRTLAGGHCMRSWVL